MFQIFWFKCTSDTGFSGVATKATVSPYKARGSRPAPYTTDSQANLMKTIFNFRNLCGNGIIALGLILLFHSNLNAQSLSSTWLQQADLNLEDFAYSVAVDSTNGWIYVAGSFSKTGNLQASDFKFTNSGSQTINASGNGMLDGYVMKLNMNGEMLWLVSMGSSKDDECLGVCLGPDNNVYVTGYFSNNFNIQSLDGLPNYNLNNFNNGGTTTDVFVASFQPNGELRWVKQEGGSGQDMGMSIAALSDGVAIIGTYFEGNEELQGTNVTSTHDDEDMFVAKYDLSGAEKWIVAGGSEETDYNHTVPVRSHKWDISSYKDTLYFLSVYNGLTFNFDYSTNYNTANATKTAASTAVGEDYILGAISYDGKVAWLRRQLVGTGDLLGMGINADCNGVFIGATAEDYLVWEGSSSGNKATTGGDDLFISAYNKSTGSPMWWKILSNSGQNQDIITSLVTDKIGNIYVSGASYTGTNLGGPSTGTSTSGQAFIFSYKTNGTYQTNYTNETTGTDVLFDLALAANKEIVSCGYSNGNVDGNQSGGNNSNDMMIGYWNNSPVFSSSCCSSPPVAGTATGPAGTVCPGSTNTVTLASYSGSIYWQSSTDGGVTWTTSSTAGAATSTWTTTNIKVRAKVVGGVDCSPVYSNTVSINESVAPLFTCPLGPVYLSVNSGCTVAMPDYISSYVAGCSAFQLNQYPGTGVPLGVGTWPVTISNTLSVVICTFNIVVTDNVAPVITCPGNMLLNSDITSCGTNVNYTIGVTDNCGGGCIPSNLSSYTLIGTYDGHNYYKSIGTYTWTAAKAMAESAGGHLATITTVGENTFLASSGNCWIGLTDQVTEGTFAWVTGEPFSYTRWFFGEPNNTGNEDYVEISNSFSGYWNDTEDIGPNNFILEFDCSTGPITPTLVSGLPSGSLFPVGETTVTYSATDGSNNTSTCSFTVKVEDHTNPKITCPADQVITAAVNCSAILPDFRGLAAASDECTSNANMVVSQFPAPGAVITGTTVITLVATDLAGNTKSCTFNAVIQDNVAPTITNCPGVINAAKSSTCNYVVPDFSSYITVSDNCSSISNILITQTPAVGTVTTGGTIAIQLAVKDLAGNVSNCNFVVSITDQTPPNLTCPGNQTLPSGASCSALLPNYLTSVVVSDNCSPGNNITLAQTPAQNTTITGITTVTITATDQAGKVANCSFIVSLQDIAPPVITSPGNQNINITSGCAVALPDYTSGLTVTDNCSLPANITRAQIPAPGTIISANCEVQITATDQQGNSSKVTFIVTPIDNTAPVMSCPNNITVNAGTNSCGAVVNYTVTATDNCTCAPTSLTGFTSLGVFNGHTYFLSNNSTTWAGANTAAQSAGAHLVTVTSLAESDFLPGTPRFYIGLTDQLVEGEWKWVNNEPFSYTRWNTGEPNNASNEDFVSMNQGGANRLWNDENGTTGRRYVIEFDCSNAAPPIINTSGASTLSGSTFPIGTTVVSHQATDAAGNAGTCSFNVTVVDNTPPTVSISGNIELNASQLLPDGNDNCRFWVTIPSPTYSDNCTVVSVTNNFNLSANASEYYPIGSTIVTWTVTDQSSNQTTVSFVVKVNNDLPLSISCSDPAAKTADPGSCSALVVVAPPTINSSCGVVTLVNNYNNSNSATGYYPVGGTEVIWTATSETGQTATCTTYVTVTDDEVPTLTMPASITLELDGNCTAIIPGIGIYVTTTDNCTTTGNIDISQNVAPGTTIGSSTVVMVTVTDESGNATSKNITALIIDHIAPTITCPSNISVQADAGYTTANITVPPPIANDNCGSYTITNSFNGTANASGIYPNGTTTVTWNINDGWGNTNSCSFTVTVNDSSAPQITCPANIVVNASAGACSAIVTVNAAIATDLDGIYSIQHNSPYGSSVTNASGTYPVGVHNITWTATDNVGMVSTCNMTITVKDVQPPTFICPSNISTLATLGQCGKNLIISVPAVSDNCGGTVSITNNKTGTSNASGFYNIGTTTVTWMATDAAGNTTTCVQNITIVDSQNPVITCPVNITVPAAANLCNAYVTIAAPTATDNCSIASISNNSPYKTSNTNASGTYPVGITAVHWTATDVNGRTSTCSMTVTVTDSQLPAITCGGNINANNTPGSCSAYMIIPSPVISDNCGILSLTHNSIYGISTSNASGNYPVGATTVTWTVKDINGNQNQCNITVTVSDISIPSITCPTDIIVNAASGTCSAYVTINSPVATDNCGIASVMNNFNNTSNASGTYSVGTHNVIWTATDVNGLSANCTMTVTIKDTEAPMITCSADVFTTATSGQCSKTMLIAPPTATDACGIATVSNNLTGNSPLNYSFPVGITTVFWNVTDVNGNTANCTQTVEVIDSENPTIICPSNITIAAPAGSCTALVSIPTPIVSDNCGIASITNSFNSTGNASGIYPKGTASVQWTVTDIHGNSSLCTMLVTVTDITPPSLNCLLNQVLYKGSNCLAILPDYRPMAAATDLCSQPVTITQTPASGMALSANTSVTITATDGANNISTCSFNITLADTTSPVILNCPGDLYPAFNSSCSYVMPNFKTLYNISATDNCTTPGLITIQQIPAANTPIFGPVAVEIRATDLAGNETICKFQVTPMDTSAPNISCAGDQQINLTADCEFVLPDYTSLASAFDNCDADPIITQTPDANTVFTSDIIVTLTATDNAFNSNSCTFMVHAKDMTAPTIICNPNVNLSAGDNCSAILPDFTALASVSDNCDSSLEITQLPAAGTSINSNTIVQIIATDDNSNISSCFITISLTDTIAPTILCPEDIVIPLNSNCEYIVPDITNQISAEDNCSASVIISQSPTAGTILSGNQVVDITVDDESGNQSTCVVNLIPSDNILPQITSPGSMIIITDAGENYASLILQMPDATDNCGIQSIVNSINPNNGAIVQLPVGNTTVNWTVTDAYGNENYGSQLVTVQDPNAPEIECAPELTFYVDSEGCLADVIINTPVVTDNDAIQIIYNDFNDTDNLNVLLGISTYSINWYALDINNNLGNCLTTVYVIDTVAPVVICPNDTINRILSDCSFILEDYTELVVTGDNCTDYTSLAIEQWPASGSLINTIGLHEIIFSVADDYGNIGYCSSMLNISSELTLEIICPDEIILQNTCNAVLEDYTSLALVTGYCSDYSITQTPSVGTEITSNTEVTLTVVDEAENMASCTFNVATQNMQSIQITNCLSDQLEQVNQNCEFTIPDYTALIEATSNCGSIMSVTQTPVAGTVMSGAGTTQTIEITVIDSTLNESYCNFDITLEDQTIPEVNNWPSDIQAQTAPGSTTTYVQVPPLSAYDNCGILSIVNNYNNSNDASDDYPLGETNVTWIVTDVNGNDIQISFTVSVINNSDFEITCPNDTTLNTVTGSCEAFVGLMSPFVPAEIGIQSVSNDYNFSPDASGFYPSGETIVTWTVTDFDGNTGTCSSTVTVLDNEFPTVLCEPNVEVTVYAGECFSFVEIPQPTFDDNCGIFVIVNNYNDLQDASGEYPIGYTDVLWAASDYNENISTCVTTVYVVDLTANQIICPNDLAVTTDENGFYTIPDFTDSVVTEHACGLEHTQTQTPSPGSVVSANTEITVTMTMDDGNTTYCSFMLFIEESTAPEILNCPDAVVLFTDENCSITIPDLSISFPTENIVEAASYEIYQSPEAGDITSAMNEIAFWVEDYFGNVSDTCYVNITLMDTIAPTASAVQQTFVLAFENCEGELPDLSSYFDISDNCGIAEITAQTPPAGTIYSSVQNIAVEITATDPSGNSVNATIMVSIEDHDGPVLNCTNDTLEITENCSVLIPDYSGLIDIEDCSNINWTSFTQTPAAGESIDAGMSSTIYLHVEDEYGNTGSCNFDVTALDILEPKIECSDDTLHLYLTQNACALPFIDYVTASDNCDPNPIISTQNGLPQLLEAGYYSALLIATDESGNESDVCEINIVVHDTIAPVFNEMEDAMICAGTIFNYDIPSAIDCSDMNITPSANNMASGTTLNTGSYTFEFTATDIWGNSSTMDFQVEVISIPQANWSLTNTLICSNGDPIWLEPSPVQTNAIYTWSINNQEISQIPIDPSTLSASNTITLTATNPLNSSCSSDSTIVVNIYAVPEIIIESEDSICGNTMTVQTQGMTNWNIHWSAQVGVNIENELENSTGITAQNYGTFEISATASNTENSCIAQASKFVTFIEQPSAPDAGTDIILYLADQLELQGSYNGVGTPSWSVEQGSGDFDDVNSITTSVSNISLGENIFILHVSNEGCRSSDSVLVNVFGLLIPSGFSPNEDDVNDAFEIRGIENLGKAELSVYNRWGQLVYASSDYKNQWNGTNQKNEWLPDDTYFYELILMDEVHQGYVIIKR
jgi:gliding motility-associated-like protein